MCRPYSMTRHISRTVARRQFSNTSKILLSWIDSEASQKHSYILSSRIKLIKELDDKQLAEKQSTKNWQFLLHAQFIQKIEQMEQVKHYN